MLASPLAGKLVITSPYGKRGQVEGVKADTSEHSGTDLRAALGTPVYASAAGVVYAYRQNGRYFGPRIFTAALAGNWLMVRYGALYVVYPHLTDSSVTLGESVRPGQIICRTGNSGGVAAHLHVGVWTLIGGTWTSHDPANYFNFDGKAATPAASTEGLTMSEATAIREDIAALRGHLNNLLTPGGEGKFSFDSAILSELRALTGIVKGVDGDLDTGLAIIKALREGQVTKEGYTYDAAILSLVQGLVSAVGSIKSGNAGAIDYDALAASLSRTLGPAFVTEFSKRLAA